MKIEDIEYLIDVSPKENLQEGCELKCYECGEWSCHKEWEQTYVPCEDCGEHVASDVRNVNKILTQFLAKYLSVENRF